MFNDHEKHTRKSTPAWAWAKQRAPGTTYGQKILKGILFFTFKAGMLLKTHVGDKTVMGEFDSQKRKWPIDNHPAQFTNHIWPVANRKSTTP
jgi:hypothetical protein